MLPPPQSLSNSKPLRSSPLAGPAVSASKSQSRNGDSTTKARGPKLVRPSTAPSTPALSTSDCNQKEAFDTAQRRRDPYTTRRPSTADPSTSYSWPKIRGFQGRPPVPITSNKPLGNEWMSTNTYSITPRFSRLSLAAAGVVLPVSARDHRQQSISRVSSSSSLVAPRNTTEMGKISNASMPSLVRTQSGPSLKDNAPPSTPSPSSKMRFSGIVIPAVTPVENSSSELSPVYPDSPVTFESESKVQGSKNRKGFSLRTIRSLGNLKNSMRTSEKRQKDIAVPSIPNQEEKNPVRPKRSGTIKRILKAVSNRFN